MSALGLPQSLGPLLTANMEGNVIVMKPAEQTPLSALHIAELIREALVVAVSIVVGIT